MPKLTPAYYFKRLIRSADAAEASKNLIDYMSFIYSRQVFAGTETLKAVQAREPMRVFSTLVECFRFN